MARLAVSGPSALGWRHRAECPRRPLPDLRGPVLRELRVEDRQRLHHGRGALHIRVVDHDVPWQHQGARVSFAAAAHFGYLGPIVQDKAP